MIKRILPRYPIYIPSKGRFARCFTAKFLAKDKVPFYLVVEPQEWHLYAAAFGRERILELPFSNQGLIAARNWIKDHATATDHLRHWQLDDNIRNIHRWYRRKRIPCHSGIALAIMEDFVDRYENIAIAGPNYHMFGYGAGPDRRGKPPFHLNCHVYSCSLILNNLPHRWRSRYNDDTDICLQVLADGWCTVLFNVFLARKLRTMIVRGGNTDDLYQGDGRLKMARSLERLWPGIVTTKRRFRRPQHVIKDSWKRFDTPLKLKSGINLDDFKSIDEYGMKLVKVKPEIKSPELRKLYQESQGVTE
jgi:hypothetical protein